MTHDLSICSALSHAALPDQLLASRGATTLGGSSAFWAEFEDFIPDPKAPLQNEIDRLARSRLWSPLFTRKMRRKALAAEIAPYRSSPKTLEGWQQLCVEIGVTMPCCLPPSIKKCKKVTLLDHAYYMYHELSHLAIFSPD